MPHSSPLRELARRGALLGLAPALRLSGRVSSARRLAGISILLLHETPAPVIPRLEAFVLRNRDRLIDYGDAVRVAQDASPAPPVGAVAFSFDDGFGSNLEAAGMLAEHGISACFFVPTDAVGMGPADASRFFGCARTEGVLSWDDLARVRAMGHLVGSHCRQHKRLVDMPREGAEAQIKDSLAALRRELGAGDHFAWPYGRFTDAPVADVVRWCAEADAVPASGIRGRNRPELFAAEGYLRRDAIDPRWISVDTMVFTTRSTR